MFQIDLSDSGDHTRLSFNNSTRVSHENFMETYEPSMERFGLLDKLSTIFKDTAAFVKSFYAGDSFDLIRFRRERGLEKAIARLTADELSSLTLKYAPVTYKPNLGDLLTVLYSASSFVVTLEKELLKPALVKLSFIANNRDVLSGNLDRTLVPLANVLERPMNEFKIGLTELTLKQNERPTTSVQPFMDYFEPADPNNNYTRVSELMSMTTKVYANTSRKNVMSYIDKLYDRLDVIVNHMNEVRVAPGWVETITNLSNALSTALMNWGVYSNVLQQLDASLSEDQPELKKQINNL